MTAAGTVTGAMAARDLIAKTLDLSVEDVPAQAAIADIPAWDSIGHVRIILTIEERLGRALTSAEIASIASVAAVATIIG